MHEAKLRRAGAEMQSGCKWAQDLSWGDGNIPKSDYGDACITLEIH